MFYEPITILSAELCHLDYYSNNDRTNELRLALLDMGLSFVGVTKFQNKKKLQSFIVVSPKHSDLLKLAEQFGQSSILVSDTSRNSIELSTKGDEAKGLGKLYLTCKENAVSQESYMTFTEDGKDFYFLTEKH